MHRQINLFRSEFGAIHRFYFTPILAFPGYQLLIASGFFSSAGRISKGMQAADNNNDLTVTASSNEEQWTTSKGGRETTSGGYRLTSSNKRQKTSCDDDTAYSSVPTITTSSVSDEKQKTPTCEGEIRNDGSFTLGLLLHARPLFFPPFSLIGIPL
jgi:hypothetical protein